MHWYSSTLSGERFHYTENSLFVCLFFLFLHFTFLLWDSRKRQWSQTTWKAGRVCSIGMWRVSTLLVLKEKYEKSRLLIQECSKYKFDRHFIAKRTSSAFFSESKRYVICREYEYVMRSLVCPSKCFVSSSSHRISIKFCIGGGINTKSCYTS
jgi:hypothetical protein